MTAIVKIFYIFLLASNITGLNCWRKISRKVIYTQQIVTLSNKIIRTLPLLSVSEEDNNNIISENAGFNNVDIEGYVNSDLTAIDSDKQIRVLLYISFALLPCLLLLPFFMSRDFIPPQ